MDKTKLVAEVVKLFSISGYKVDTSVSINHREIDIVAEERQGLIRKIILIECADYKESVGIQKLQDDISKLNAAKEQLKSNAVIAHVSTNGYTSNAIGYALDNGITTYTLAQLRNQLINFEIYIEKIENDLHRSTIEKEYQPNQIHYEGVRVTSPSIVFLDKWLESGEQWLTILGDYGVGKSWTLKKYLYHRISEYKKSPENNLLPFFIPLQHFIKSVDFKNIILKCFTDYGIEGTHYGAFEYLMLNGKILFLLDSFDEMAQNLSKKDISSNLNELLSGINQKSKTIMTSRPNYFEGYGERLLLVERDGRIEWIPLDDETHIHLTALSADIRERLDKTQFARIKDLTREQQFKLFATVLTKDSGAYKALINIFDRFHNVETISQKAVIARLLTQVATTIAENKDTDILKKNDLSILNEAKIFEIIAENLLRRDTNIGSLSAGQRLFWLRSFAIHLQQKNQSFFADPLEMKSLISMIFKKFINSSDTPAQLLENTYRTCRRHSGLTTENQFRDTSGFLDSPVDDEDSMVGFSHNSLREYFVADAFRDYIMNGKQYDNLFKINVNDVIVNFFCDFCKLNNEIANKISQKFKIVSCNEKEFLFKFICGLIAKDKNNLSLLGSPIILDGIDISDVNFSGLDLRNAIFQNCIVSGTDFRSSILQNASFNHCIIEKATFDEAILSQCDFKTSEIVSIYVFDEYSTRTTSILAGKDSIQWLHAKLALVTGAENLNQLLGQNWYEAAREVTRTIERRIAGTHQDISLEKGVSLCDRHLAREFIDYLRRKNILIFVAKSDNGPGDVVKLNSKYRKQICSFSKDGIISDELMPFFQKKIPQESLNCLQQKKHINSHLS